MKKFLSILLLTAFSMMICGSAFAEAEYATTKAFVAVLEETDTQYVCQGVDADGDDHVAVLMSSAEIPYTIHCYFEDDLQHTAIFVWNIITFDAEDTLKVMHVCNTLNATYNYVCFYVDETDNTVTCSMNLIYRDDNVGQVCAEAMLYLMSIIEDAYPSLSDYDQ